MSCIVHITHQGSHLAYGPFDDMERAVEFAAMTKRDCASNSLEPVDVRLMVLIDPTTSDMEGVA